MFTAVENRLGAAGARTKTFLGSGSRPFWLIVAALTIFTWPFGIGVVGASLDFSWISGLYMATDQGRHFGTEIVYTFGPLGFLAWPSMWIGYLAILSFLYWVITYAATVAVLTWALRRTLGLVGAVFFAALVTISFGFLEQLPVVLAVGVCYLALREDRPPHGMEILAFGGGLLCAVEPLVKLSYGPPVVAIVVLTMIGARADIWRWGAFLVTAIGGFFFFWFTTGQGLGNLWPYVDNGIQIIKGYGEAMGYDLAETWELVFIIVFALTLVAFIHRARWRDTRARWFATAVTAVVAYTVFKYGTTQFSKAGPPVAAMSTLLMMFLMAPWPPRRAPTFAVAALILSVLIWHASGAAAGVDVIGRAETFKESVEFSVRPGLRHQKITQEKEKLQGELAVPPPVLEALGSKSVAVEPWEITVAWAYGLNWKPLPDFQNYQDYTQQLDRLNATAAEDPEKGPQMLLRQTPAGVVETGGRPTIFERQPAWDPPEQTYAEFCNFVPTLTEGAWQVLSRIPDRCGEPKLAGSVTVDPGQTFQIPQAGKDEVVYMRVHGMKLEGLEKLGSLFWRPSERHAVVNDGQFRYRMPPDTTEDPMIVSVDRELGHGPELPELPELQDMALEGASGPFTVDFYRVKLQPTGNVR
jgi:hypothetical protein